VKNIHKWKRVESQIKTSIKEAKEILKESHFPTTHKDLEKKTKEHKDRLTLEAELIIHAEYYLRSAIENNKADEAAIRMLNVLVAYERMIAIRDFPDSEKWMKLGMNEYDVHIDSLKAGFKNLLGNKTKPNAVTEDSITKMKKYAEEIRVEHPFMPNKTIAYKLIEKFENMPGASYSYITKNKIIPPKKRKK
jgi:hypothetical protein